MRISTVATFAMYCVVTNYGQLTQTVHDFECSTLAFQAGPAMKVASVATQESQPGRDTKLRVRPDARVQNMKAKSDTLADSCPTSLSF